MTLTLFEDARGFWEAEAEECRLISFDCSSVDISVTDGMGNVLDGTFSVNGAQFSVKRGRCKILTEALHRIGSSHIEFISSGGIKRSCASIRCIGDKTWYFPSIREAFSDDEIVSLLRKLERMREKLASAKALCPDAVSSVLGI